MRNAKFLKAFLALVVSTLILFTGCANKQKKLTKTELKAQGIISSFEVLPSETKIGDFDWDTNGYVQLEQFNKYKTKGKFAVKAIFSIPSDFLTEEQLKDVKAWISSMTMGINTLTKLTKTDWSLYKNFNVDVYSQDDKTRNFYIKFTDVNGKEYLAMRPVQKSKNKIKIPLDDVKAKRIDLANITSISFYLDTIKEEKDVTLFIDYARLTP